MIWNPDIYHRVTDEMRYDERYTAATLAVMMDVDADAVYHELCRLEKEGKVERIDEPESTMGVCWQLIE